MLNVNIKCWSIWIFIIDLYISQTYHAILLELCITDAMQCDYLNWYLIIYLQAGTNGRLWAYGASGGWVAYIAALGADFDTDCVGVVYYR